MKVSLNTVKQFIDFELPAVDELVKRINEQLGGVEEVIDLEQKYKGIVIVRVVSAEKHPNADKLTVCLVDDGGTVQGVERDENGHVQVVCGAPNVREGMLAVWLPPGSTVPASFGNKEPFVLAVRELRGIVSNGMLAASDELAIGSDHDGIIELTTDDLPVDVDERALMSGQDFAELFGLDDTIIEIENKMFTHRPDLFGQLGVAREIAGIFHRSFSSPKWYLTAPKFENATGLDLEISNDAGDSVPRFMAVGVKDVRVRPSPFWFQCELVRLGAKPINNIVDITNYFMLLTGQPLHAYDYDKLHGWRIGARMAKPGEQATLLNGKTYQLDETDIVIVDEAGVIGLGGVMGGRDSEVSDTTTNIVLECATFDMYTVRKTSMRHGLFTDAVTRFNKGQSPLQNDRVLARALQGLTKLAGGEQASEVFDFGTSLGEDEAFRQNERWSAKTIPAEFINARLGTKLSDKDMLTLLENVEFHARAKGGANEISVNPPFWRTDIELPEDVVEEVGRLYGFDKLPHELPRRSIEPTPTNQKRQVKSLIRDSFRRMGANEALTYSFVHKNTLTRAEQDPEQAFRLGNALSPDLQYYRLSVLPSLLDKVHGNLKAGYDEFLLYEIGKGHNKKYHSDDDNGLPGELEFVDGVYASKQPGAGAPYYHVRQMVTQLGRDLGLALRFQPITKPLDFPVTAPFDLTRSALVETTEGEFIGLIGELKQTVLGNFKLPAQTAALTLDLGGLKTAYGQRRQNYQPLSKFPSIANDISLKTSSDQPYAEILSAVETAAQEALPDVRVATTPVTIYQSDDDTATKTTTFHLVFTSHDKTLTDDDLKPVREAIAVRAREAVGAEVV